MASNFLSRLLLVRREKKLGKHHASGGSIMSQVPLNCELPSSFSGSVTLALFLSLGVFSLHSISSNFPGKISSALFFFFCLCCSCTTFCRGCQPSVCVHRDFEVPGHSLSCSAGPPRFPVLCLNMYLVFIRATFHGSPPLHINIVCWTGISGRSRVETWEYLLFKGLVPYAVLARGRGWGGSKGVCFLVERDAGLTQCH